MNFWKSIKFSLLIQQIAGTSPFSFTKNNFKLTLFSRIYSILLLCTYFILCAIGILFGDKDEFRAVTPNDEPMSFVTAIILVIEITFTNLFFILFQLIAQFNVNHQILLLNKIYEIDKIIICTFKYKINYGKKFKSDIFGILVICVMFVSLVQHIIFVFLQTKFTTFVFGLTFAIQFFCRLIAAYAYVNYVCLIYFRWNILADIIHSKFVGKSQQQTISCELIRHKNYQILICCNLFQELHNSIRILNKTFGPIVLLTILHSFTLIFTQSFILAVYVSVTSVTQTISMNLVYYICIWILHDIIKIISITLTTQFVIDKARACGKSLKNVDRSNVNAEVRDLLDNFSLWLQHHDIQFTAQNIFRIDLSLIYAIVGATASYLLVLVQLKIQEESITNTPSRSNATFFM